MEASVGVRILPMGRKGTRWARESLGAANLRGTLSGIGVEGCLSRFAFGVRKIQMASSLLGFRFRWEWDPNHQPTE